MSRAKPPLGLPPVTVPEGFPGRITFVKSASKNSESPSSLLPEVAVCGRSNVGKSSLLNVLCNRRQMARVSSTPGRTRLINFFAVQDLLMLVDLPGFGFAKGPLDDKIAWGRTIQGYLSDRQQLRLTLLLVDARRGPEKEEQELLLWFREAKQPCLGVMTKADKITKSELETRRKRTAELLFMPPADVITFSALSRLGREAIWSAILAGCGVDPAAAKLEAQAGAKVQAPAAPDHDEDAP